MQLHLTTVSGLSTNRPEAQQRKHSPTIGLPLINQDILTLSNQKNSPLFGAEPPEVTEFHADNAETTAKELIDSFRSTRVRSILEEDILKQNPLYGRDTRLLDQNQYVAIKHLQAAAQTPNMSEFKAEQVAKKIQKEIHQIVERRINSQ
jgi:hypothetical protein